ncbi:hypothetical protein KUH03_26710 [Sphingobacterium sp. E70]|uniref:hypothetical protein n=1 Tax=Sphingobacterium sp. E70 TaxID=2853439 RepID=UPI00211C67FB|nr:hypothetical protein [Sphingobacterium sp. E70]ULT22863.1 hypothetical protein KUH03_26710 [Sphingobacterium sp. E70]
MKESGRTRGNAGFTLIYRIPNVITFRNVATYLYTKAYDSPFGSFDTYTKLNPYEKIYDEQGKYNIRFGNSDSGIVGDQRCLTHSITQDLVSVVIR